METKLRMAEAEWRRWREELVRDFFSFPIISKLVRTIVIALLMASAIGNVGQSEINNTLSAKLDEIYSAVKMYGNEHGGWVYIERAD